MQARFFNTAGPCLPDIHYMLPAEQRLPEARAHVERGDYFVIHAPRQTGKTTLLRSLAQSLTAEGRVAALHVSCETAEPARDDVREAQLAILDQMRLAAENRLPPALQPPPEWPVAADLTLLSRAISAWSRVCPRPLVLLFDEIDAVRGESLRAVLRQLRAGFPDRFEAFARSVILSGLRDVRDYEAASGGDPQRLGTSSPFNVKVESLRLGDFSADELGALYAQHTAATGQAFEEGALERAFALTQGQPWLVNALAREATERMGIPRTVTITAEHMDRAKERLILARATHLDSLVVRLQEPRVRRLVEPLLAGDLIEPSVYDDDVSYLRDLGLASPEQPFRVANPIYREVIVRVLAGGAEANITLPRSYVRTDGSLDLRALLAGFADFWKEQGSALAHRMPYHEVGAQLVLMAWLQRVVNGGGFVEREVGLGRRRIDLLLRWPLSDGGWQREALELKMRRDGEADPTAAGLAQLEDYAEALGLAEGTLVVFDRRSNAPEAAQRTRFDHARSPRHGWPVLVLRA